MSADFASQGYSIVAPKRQLAVQNLRSALVKGLQAYFPGPKGLSDEDYLNSFHKFADPARLNDARVAVHRDVCATEAYRRELFEFLEPHLVPIVGTEIVMQRQVSFVIHMPNDPANVIYLHTDAWAGDSPYEIVAWIPLVNVYKTKTMFICPLEKTLRHLRALRATGARDLESARDLMDRVRPDTTFLEMKFGQALLFSTVLLHGAEENKEPETRFILNVRFKSLFSPYGTKALGETFLPVTSLPTTRIAIEYEREFGIIRG